MLRSNISSLLNKPKVLLRLLSFAEQPNYLHSKAVQRQQIYDLQAKLCVLACSAKLSKQPVGFVSKQIVDLQGCVYKTAYTASL